MGFEPTITEFRSDALTEWAIRPCVHLPLRSNFLQLLQLQRLFSVMFHFGHSFRQSPRLFSSGLYWGSHMSVEEIPDTYGIENWSLLWRRFRKFDRVGFEPTITVLVLDTLTYWAIWPWVQLALRPNFLKLLQLHCLYSVTWHFGHCLRESPRLFSSKFSWSHHTSIAEWADTFGTHHWRILWKS